MPGLRKNPLSYEARAWPKMSLNEAKIERWLKFLNVELLNSKDATAVWMGTEVKKWKTSKCARRLGVDQVASLNLK